MKYYIYKIEPLNALDGSCMICFYPHVFDSEIKAKDWCKTLEVLNNASYSVVDENEFNANFGNLLINEISISDLESLDECNFVKCS